MQTSEIQTEDIQTQDIETGPVLVRGGPPPNPGMHSHNMGRRVRVLETRSHRKSRVANLALGIAGLGLCSYFLANRYVYQVFENWSFDQQIAGRSSVSFAEYLKEQPAFPFFLGEKASVLSPPPAAPALEDTEGPQRPPHGSVLGRVSVARLNISSVVREGVDAATMERAVGHVPATALAGQLGNFAIAAHRDTLFRALKDIQIGDHVLFESTGGKYTYEVVATKVVKPSDVSVLRADGGPGAFDEAQTRPNRLLTMITCYPLNYTGSAPERFIVQARLIPAIAPATLIPATIKSTRHMARRTSAKPARTQKAVAHSSFSRPMAVHPVKPAKRGFWHKFLHIS